MKRASRQRLGFFAIVLALLALVVWQWRHDASTAPGVLLALAPDQITHVALSIGNAPAMHYEKRDGHWWRVDDAPVRADDGRLAELADTAAAPVRSWRSVSDFNLAKIGLEPAQAVLTLEGHTLAFGETAVTGALRYVRVGQRIALVPARYSPRPPTGAVRELGR